MFPKNIRSLNNIALDRNIRKANLQTQRVRIRIEYLTLDKISALKPCNIYQGNSRLYQVKQENKYVRLNT